MLDKSAIAYRLKSLRKEKGITQKAVCESIDIQTSAMSNYEAGARIPNAQTLIALADYYDTTVDYILRGTPPPNSLNPYNTLSIEIDMLEKSLVKLINLAGLYKHTLDVFFKDRQAKS